MKNLVTKLQNEAGLTLEQARMAVGIFRDYLIENNECPDLLDMLKVKSNHIVDQMKTTYENWADKADALADRVEDKVDDWADQVEDKTEKAVKTTKRKVKKTVDKVSEYLDD